MKFENDLIEEPFKVKGSSSKTAQFQIKRFKMNEDSIQLIDLRTGEKVKHEDFFYLMGREIEIVKDKDTLSDELKLHKNYVPTMERVKEIYFEYDKSNLVAFVRNAENMELQRCKILFRKYLKEFIQYFSMGKDTRNFSNNEIMVELKKTFGEELL